MLGESVGISGEPMRSHPHIVIRPQDHIPPGFERRPIARECNPLVRLEEVSQWEFRNERFQHRRRAIGRVVINHNYFPGETRRDVELRE
jgi:hypothetical protein